MSNQSFVLRGHFLISENRLVYFPLSASDRGYGALRPGASDRKDTPSLLGTEDRHHRPGQGEFITEQQVL